jgi:ribosomal protein S18 acetylase RimI-like enzyme
MSEVAADVPEVVSILANEIWHECYSGIISDGQIDYMLSKYQSAAAIKDDVDKGGYVYHLVSDGSRYVGYCGICIDGDSVYLSKFYVLAAFRGKGYGSRLLEFIEAYAMSNSLHHIHLRVNRNNTRSIGIYHACGFREYAEDRADIGNGFFMDDILMDKCL